MVLTNLQGCDIISLQPEMGGVAMAVNRNNGTKSPWVKNGNVKKFRGGKIYWRQRWLNYETGETSYNPRNGRH